MMCETTDGEPDQSTDTGGTGAGADTGGEDVDGAELAQFSALLEDSTEDLYDNAPCGYLSTLMDGRIAKVNTTLLDWLGFARTELVGRKRFSDLLTVGGRLYHETHFAPLLAMRGQVSGIALELKGADGARLPVLVTSQVKTGSDGQPLLIRTTVFDARDRRAYENELLRARKEAERAHAEAEAARQVAEMERVRLRQVVAVLQSSLLPPSLPQVPGVQAAAYYHPASVDDLGGDFYDLFALGADRWAFFLGDVCGKGPEAAAVTSLIRFTLHAALLHAPDPVAALTLLNTMLHERYTGDDPRYCTVIAGTLTPRDGDFDITVAAGGHPPAMLLRANGTAEQVRTPGGMLVGIMPTPRFTTAATTLAAGDTLLLYTDGLTEARTRQGPRYSEDDLHIFTQTLAPAGAGQTITALTALLESFGDGLEDDTALLALGIPAAGADSDVA
ncbi:PP2C family protein-serine/threonine phosphatase [Streptomyces sp. NBC_01190]|uniref:PP2C family protein-serine/threonine phosphatase n=1 Tax=Streptomyces sp. NBC_01190 TaxID=2903767 RepID=UPI00386DB4C0|nr:SpoIIE family protein phosphatase [Streptomyces sp. NBC_01190]